MLNNEDNHMIADGVCASNKKTNMKETWMIESSDSENIVKPE